MNTLQDKVAIVTGGANGIGAAIVNEFLQEGAKFVAIVDLDDLTGIEFEKANILKYGTGKTKFYKCDVTKDEQIFGVFDDVTKKYEYIDIVVNNAGIADETTNKYKTLIAINYTAVVTSSYKALELMRADNGGRGGTIINVSSIVALSPAISIFHIYAGTKSAVLQFSNRLGKKEYYDETKVRVLTVCFGATETAIQESAARFDQKLRNQKQSITEKILVNIAFQTAEDAAKGVVHSYKVGESGGTWLIDDKNAVNITERMRKAYEIMIEGVIL